jgi:glycosyltransferase involved in cell wall biosynthesis
MKVLLANSERGFRGGEYQTVALVKGLLDAGIDVRAAVMRGSRLEEELRGVARVCTVSFETIPVATPYRLRRFILEFQPDILHAQTSRSHTHLWFTRMLLVSPPPLIVSRRVAFRPRGGLKYRSGVAHYIPISKAAADGLSSVGVTSERMTIVPSGVEVDRFSTATGDERLLEEWGIESGITLIGTIAALEREKGLLTLIEAAEEIVKKRSDCVFLVIGEGSLRGELESGIRRRGIGGRIIILPQTAPLQEILPLFDVYVQPSLEEGLSTALIAAAAAGLPIVAADTGGMPEIIGDDGGLLVKPGDSEALKAGIARLLDDEDLKGQISERARRRALAFDIERTLLGTLSVYHRILGRQIP